MKKLCLLIIIMMVSILFIGCGKKELNYEKHLISLSYSYGNNKEGLYDYNITLNDDKIIFVLSSNTDYIEKEVDKTKLDELDTIIKKYAVLDWDGYNKHDKIKDDDEISFSIQIGYDDGSNYNASGYGNYPKNFDDVHKELIKIFNDINNQ